MSDPIDISPRTPPLVLASTSPYRRELLARLGLPFITDAPQVDESPSIGESAEQLARRLSLEKARAVAPAFPGALVIGSDQTASIDGVSIIGKPGGHREAAAQLHQASGQVVRFHTGIALIGGPAGFCATQVVLTQVRMRQLDPETIARYLAREPAYDCAGSAKVEGLGIALMESVEGPDPTALVGLPLIALVSMLTAAGVQVP